MFLGDGEPGDGAVAAVAGERHAASPQSQEGGEEEGVVRCESPFVSINSVLCVSSKCVRVTVWLVWYPDGGGGLHPDPGAPPGGAVKAEGGLSYGGPPAGGADALRHGSDRGDEVAAGGESAR